VARWYTYHTISKELRKESLFNIAVSVYYFLIVSLWIGIVAIDIGMRALKATGQQLGVNARRGVKCTSTTPITSIRSFMATVSSRQN
jgi:hypothetical protein